MSVFNEGYRLFFKKLTDLDGYSITSNQLIVLSHEIQRDLLTKVSSRFEVLEIPQAIENGDIIGVYDIFGTIVFLGQVSLIDDSTIEATQMLDIFDDNWLWNNPRSSTIEETIRTIIQNDYQNNQDTLMQSIFRKFVLNTTSSTNLTLATEEERYITSFAHYLYDIYEKYGVVLDFDIPFSNSSPTINIGQVTSNKLTISNNTLIFRNFDIITNVFETNKLIVYSESTGTYRGSWFTTTSGITDNPSALNRIQKIKTNIIFSDDDINVLKASSLRNEIFNHEITCELVIKNNILPISKLHLGQEVDIYFNGNYYNSILTGYKTSMTNQIESEVITLKFGLVRTRLTSKLFKKLNK